MSNTSITNLKVWSFFLGLLIISFSAAFALYSVKHQLGGYDLSPLIDLQWRLSNGELPHVDFLNTLPYAFILLVKAVSWGELSWLDLTYINILAAFVIYAFIVICGRNQIAANVFWLGAISVSLPLIYTNHLWHSSISQYFAMFFFIATYIGLDKRKLSFLDYLMIFVSAGLLITAKQNIAAPILLLATVFFAITSQNRKISLVIIFGSITGLTISSLILSQPIDSFIYIYTSVLGRVETDLSMYTAFAIVKTHWVAVPLMLFITYLFYRSAQIQSSNHRLFLYIFAFASLIPILTDWDTKWNNLSLPIFIAVISYFSGASNSYKTHQTSAFMFSVIVLYLVAGYGGLIRERMKHVGPFYQDPAEVELTDGYFKGLYVGTNLAGLINELHQVRDEWSEAKIFFGPRIEFAYLETQTPSPNQFPLWFHPGTSYAMTDSNRVIQTFKNADFEVLVFAKNDRTRLPVEILQFIDIFYSADNQYDTVDVFIRR